MSAVSKKPAGRIFIWHGGSLWLSRGSGTVETHAHHAIQIALALEGSMRLSTPSDPSWRSYTAAVISQHQPHALEVTDALTGMIFVDPETHVGRSLAARSGEVGIAPIPADVEFAAQTEFGRALTPPIVAADVIAAAHAVVGMLTAGVEHRTIMDSRVKRAIELVEERLPRPVVQKEIAQAVFLSPSRFRHLFVEETGMAFRPYILWMRLHLSLARFTAGESLTDAAHAAGFADVAHLSRTFRRMFGVNPSSFAWSGDVSLRRPSGE